MKAKGRQDKKDLTWSGALFRHVCKTHVCRHNSIGHNYRRVKASVRAGACLSCMPTHVCRNAHRHVRGHVRCSYQTWKDMRTCDGPVPRGMFECLTDVYVYTCVNCKDTSTSCIPFLRRHPQTALADTQPHHHLGPHYLRPALLEAALLRAPTDGPIHSPNMGACSHARMHTGGIIITGHAENPTVPVIAMAHWPNPIPSLVDKYVCRAVVLACFSFETIYLFHFLVFYYCSSLFLF